MYKFTGFNVENEYCIFIVNVYSTKRLNPINKTESKDITTVNTGFFHFGNLLYLKRNIFT